VVSEPPRPSVVTSFEVEVTPWNPATITTLSSARASLMRPARTSRMRALPCRVSVMMPAWEPVNDLAVTPRSAMAMASSDMEMRSPAVSSMSISRGGGSGETRLASAIRSSVESPMAETTTTTSFPARREATTRSATRRIRDASPTEVPPYFWTTRAMGVPCGNGLEAGGTSLSSRAEGPGEVLVVEVEHDPQPVGVPAQDEGRGQPDGVDAAVRSARHSVLART